MAEKIRWGILSTGSIAHSFARGLEVLPDAELVAVGSRTQSSADDFGRTFDVPHRHGSYEDLAHDPDVDVIYVATPHVFHKENTLLCLNAGKAVLCEKPFTLNAGEAREVIDVARERGLFLMEAMWTRFLPAMVQVRQWLEEGAIGEVRMIAADFGFRAEFDPESRLFAPELGGGALLDVGIYPVSLTSMILGQPNQVASLANLGETGVDEQSAFILGYPGGELALLSAAVRTQTPTEATIMGTEGQIRVHPPAFKPEWVTLVKPGFAQSVREAAPAWLVGAGQALGLDRFWHRVAEPKGQSLHFPLEGNGYNYEAVEVMRCLREGRLESEVIPLDESLAIMETLDRIRATWGLVYPGEGKN
jgi:predicted dehydrogenase